MHQAAYTQLSLKGFREEVLECLLKEKASGLKEIPLSLML